jgi:hypothetical protein
MDFYPDAEEEIPKDLPAPKGTKIRMTAYVDADHAHDLSYHGKQYTSQMGI